MKSDSTVCFINIRFYSTFEQLCGRYSVVETEYSLVSIGFLIKNKGNVFVT